MRYPWRLTLLFFAFLLCSLGYLWSESLRQRASHTLIAQTSFQEEADFFHPTTLLTVEVKPQVSFNPQTGEFTYTYELSNSEKSHQRLNTFDLTIGPRVGIVRGIQAEGKLSWKPGVTRYRDLKTDKIDWIAAGRTIRNFEEIFTPPPDAILPGDSVKGLGAVARNLPGIRLAWYRGWVKPTRGIEVVRYVNEKERANFKIPGDIPDETLNRLIPQYLPVHLSAVQIKTVGPDVLPDLTNDQLLDRLIQLKEHAFQLGWIDNQGVANSLNKKLEAAKKKLQQGEIKTTANILHAFIHDLEAQHRKEKERDKEVDKDKHVNDHAFYLLKPNAEFILFRLGRGEKK